MKRDTSNFRKWTHFTKEEINSWGKDKKACRTCKKVKNFSEFHKGSKNQLFSLSSDCKECRVIQSKKTWKNIKKNNPTRVIYNRAKSRAIINNIEFDIEISDIIIPLKCPIFDIELKINDPDWTPSIDRINPRLGYIRGNIIIVSNKANRIKNNALPEDILKVGRFYSKLIPTMLK